jgi:hypothetical protein
MRGAITRILSVCAVALIAVHAATAAPGEYQSTRDGRTKIWNNNPKPGDEGTWVGGRDGDGYASGFGTLSWYSGKKQSVKILGVIPDEKPPLYARYYGNMVRGKLNGLVNVHTKRETGHAVFVDGARTSRWIAGRAPSRLPQEPGAEIAKQKSEEPEPPAEGPKATPKPKTQPGKQSKYDVDQSLRDLVGPLDLFRPNPGPKISSTPAKKEEPPPTTTPEVHLTKEEAMDMADAEARGRGYNPMDYGRTDPQYDPKDRFWSITYRLPDSDQTEGVRSFIVTIDDKTKGMVLVPGKN